MTQHPYCYPGTDVLRNKEDIRNGADLERFERRHSANRLETMPPRLPISIDGYRAIHRYLLQDVYDWAGEYRFVNTGRGAPFCKAIYIAAEMEKRFAAIKAGSGLRGLPIAAFAGRAAEHLNELNAIHPFLDGNGRTLRAFLELLAAKAGHEIDIARIAPKAWNEASILGFHKQDHRPMAQVVAAAVADSRCAR